MSGSRVGAGAAYSLTLPDPTNRVPATMVGIGIGVLQEQTAVGASAAGPAFTTSNTTVLGTIDIAF